MERANHAPDGWQLWAAGEVLGAIEQIEPMLESWDAKCHPSQIRLQTYLAEVERQANQIATPPNRLFLDMQIGVKDAAHLSRHHDLENYLTPVVRRLGSHRFCFVRGTKRLGIPSSITIGIAVPRAHPFNCAMWGHFSCRAGSGPDKPRWKAGIRDALAATNPALLPPGPITVHLAWRCAPSRNWVALWKPTGDAMGPVLGPLDAPNPFNPHDDRITVLGLHRNLVAGNGHDVDVAMWWRSTT